MKDAYAIVETGGKQYKVIPGQKVDVDRLGAGEGQEVELAAVLFIADGAGSITGSPTIEGARVTATCLGEKKDSKVTVFKYKSKVRYRRKKGHRQPYTTLEIKEIVKPGAAAPARKARKAKAAAGGES